MVKRDKTKKKSNHKIKINDESKIFAFLATFFSIIGFIIVLIAKKEDKYVMYYAKQSLVIFIVFIIGSIISIIPLIGWIIGPIILLIEIILWIFSWIYSLSGETKETPLIGKYARNINI